MAGLERSSSTSAKSIIVIMKRKNKHAKNAPKAARTPWNKRASVAKNEVKKIILLPESFAPDKVTSS